MSLLKEISIKYNGKYFEEPLKSSITVYGKIGSQKKEAIFRFDDYEIKIGLVANYGAAYGTTPYRIYIRPKFKLKSKFSIKPKSSLFQFITGIKYKIKGERSLKNKLMSNKILSTDLQKGDYYINCLSEKLILLTPTKINSMEEASNIFKIIEEIIKVIK